MVSSSSPSMKGRGGALLDENGNNNGFVGSPAAAAAAHGATARSVYGASASDTANKPAEMNLLHHQNHHHHHQSNQQPNHNRARSLASGASIAHGNSPAAATTQEQQQQIHQHHQGSKVSPTTQPAQFHLSRAINTKTTSHVLNHHHNNNISSASSNGSASSGSVAMRNSGRKLQKHRHHQQQQQQYQQQQQQISTTQAAVSNARTPIQLLNNNNSILNVAHHQSARIANECCLPGSPYHCSPTAAAAAGAAGFVASPPIHQQQWRDSQQARYVAAAGEPAPNTSFYSAYNDSDGYLQPAAADCNYESPPGRSYQYSSYQTATRKSLNLEQPPNQRDSMDFYRPSVAVLQQQQQQQQYQHQQYHPSANDNLNSTSHMFQTSPPVGQLPLQYNRSYSFGSSLTLDSKKIRSQNPLASLFQSPQLSASTRQPQQYANTIQVTRRNKSANKLGGPNDSMSGTSNGRSAPGSLKRVKSSLLSAQQASYEAMRTIDMYLIRQIARSCMVS